jgi:ankyrin repeat protein
MFKLHAEDFLLSEDRFGWSSLHFAVEKNNVSNINWLFRMGVGEYITSIRIHQLLALTNAKQTHDVLLRWVEKVDTILYHQQQTSKISVEKEIGLSTELMAKLLDNVNTPSGTLLQTPLHKAAMYGNIKAVQGLLKQGAQVDVLDANGWNAFHVS